MSIELTIDFIALRFDHRKTAIVRHFRMLTLLLKKMKTVPVHTLFLIVFFYELNHNMSFIVSKFRSKFVVLNKKYHFFSWSNFFFSCTLKCWHIECEPFYAMRNLFIFLNRMFWNMLISSIAIQTKQKTFKTFSYTFFIESFFSQMYMILVYKFVSND